MTRFDLSVTGFLSAYLAAGAICFGQPRACCLPDGSCVDIPKSECLAAGGYNGGQGTSCDLFLCGCPGQQDGCAVACCFDDGNCYDYPLNICSARGGVTQGEGTSCQWLICECTTPPADCAFRACCLPGGTCVDVPKDQCLFRGGLNAAQNTECQTYLCPCPEAPSGCDDGVSCTTDTCDLANDTCAFAPTDSLCDDASFCNGAEICDPAAGCQAGTPPDCDDGVGCTVDQCNDLQEICEHLPDDGQCDDGAYCNGAETCVLGVGCQTGTPVSCDDGVDCTADSCNETTDSCENLPDNGACDNGQYCDGAETCDAVQGCQPGSNPCPPALHCDEAGDACVQCLIDAHCDDGMFCNGPEVCQSGTCFPGPPPDCVDDVACTVDICDEINDQCVHTPDDSYCDDGAYCNGAEFCDPTSDCLNGTPVNCDDGVFCTLDVCNESSDTCLHAPENSLCNNGQFCDGVEICDAVADCVAGAPPVCDDGVDCTIDSCDESADACVSTANHGSCDDGDTCTQDICTLAGCVHVSDCRACCLPDLTCNDLIEADCLAQGGVSGAAGTSCAFFICGCPDEPLGCDYCPDEPALLIPDEPSVEQSCDDDVDNDCDGSTDTDDSDCAIVECTGGCGDFSGDSLVNLADFVIFAACFGLSPSSSESCACTDLDADGSINLEDLGVFATRFANPATASCDDGDPCTRDACMSIGCQHTRLCRACCLPDGSCIDTFKGNCISLGGAHGGQGTECGTFICGCPGEPEGCTVACCFPDGNCYDDDPQDCLAVGATPQAEGTSCLDTACTCQAEPQDCAYRACCLPDGSCENLPKGQCLLRGGANGGNGTSCGLFACGCPEDPEGCPYACCRPDGPCVEVHQSTCLGLSGEPQALGSPCPQIVGSTYYVDTNNPAADDCNSGTETSPWKTLTRAANAAVAGDTVFVKTGVYAETLAPANSGTPGAMIVFRPYPGDECKGEFTKTDCRVVLDGENIRNNAIAIYPHSYIRVEGFEIQNYLSAAVVVAGFSGTNDNQGIQVVNNYIHDCPGSNAIVIQGGTDCLVENNEIRDVFRAIKLKRAPTPTGVVIRGNHIWQTYCDGIRSGGEDIVIESNWIHSAHPTGCHRDALDLANSIRNLIVRNNLIYDYTQLVYFPTGDAPDLVVEDVQIYGNVMYTDVYPGDPDGEAPGVFFSTASQTTSFVQNVQVHSNTFGWLGLPAIRLIGNISDVTIRNNIFYDAGINIEVGDPASISSDYNLYYCSPGCGETVVQWDQEGPNSVFGVDPGFVEYVRHVNHDFHLLPTSPAIDAGDPNLGGIFVLPVPFVDLDGSARPQDQPGIGQEGPNAYDIGAYEFVAP